MDISKFSRYCKNLSKSSIVNSVGLSSIGPQKNAPDIRPGPNRKTHEDFIYAKYKV